jgi:predicted nucleic acid-binding protein
MKTGRRKIYWDNTCWLAWLNGEGVDVWPLAVVQGIKDVVAEVEANKAILFTSTITRGEIYQGKLSQAQRDMFARLMRRRNVVEINADSRIMDKASNIREHHDNKTEKRKISTPDATHLATAILYGADEFQTMDGLQKGGSNRRKLIALSGNVAGHDLKVIQPYPLNVPPPAELVVIDGPLLEKARSDHESEKQKVDNEKDKTN